MLQPPIAPKKPITSRLHEDVRTDDYAWIRNRETDPEVMRYLEAENAYTKANMEPTTELQETLFKEMCARIQLSDTSVPYFDENYYYYTRTLETAEYPILCRRAGEMSNPEEIILDENALAAGQPYFHVGDYDISPNQRYLAYTQDIEGNEAYVLHIKDLHTQKTQVTPIHHISPEVLWANDNKTLFFIKLDVMWRPFAVYTYDTETQKVWCCYTENDATYSLQLEKSKTEQFILLTSASKTTTEVHYLPADDPHAEFKIFYPRQEGIKYSITPHIDTWFLCTNLHAKNFRVVQVPMNHLEMERWKEIIPHCPEVKIEELEIFRDFLVVVERKQAHLHLRVFNLHSEKNEVLKFHEDVYTVNPTHNINFNSTTLRVAYDSLTTPHTIYDIDLHTHDRLLLKQTHVLGDFNQTDYHCERIYAKAEDGTLIPISLVYHHSTPRDGTAPLYLYGYGSYGISLDPWFSNARLSLLNRGIIYALAHVRGGGDNGEYWYEAGKLLQKKHTFNDFINCMEHLITMHYTCKEKLIISGGSAGGLLVGAVINQRPELCAVAVAHVPFVDALNTMLDPTIPLTIGEFKEWGNPAHQEFYDYIKSYSPYDNVKHQAYPALLATAGMSDPRVQYWEPAKWVAKLRQHKTDDNILLLRINMAAGHQGASGRFSTLKEVAFEYAFVLINLK